MADSDAEMHAVRADMTAEDDVRALVPPADIAELVLALTRMSARSVIPLVAVSRPGETQWRA